MFREYIKKYGQWSLIISVLTLILAIMLIINPIGSVSIFIKLFGIILIIEGIINLINYFKTEPEARIGSFELFEGIFYIISGILIMVCSNLIIGIFPIIMSIWIIIKSIFHFQNAINLKAIPESGWKWILALSIVTFILGLIIMFNPFSSAAVTTRIIGIFLAISEVINIIDGIITVSKLK